MANISISEIAKLAQVSKTTVSRIINNKGYVSAETRKRVEDVIKNTNYIPNRLARNLSNGHSKTVAIMCPYPGYENIVRGILTEAFHDKHATLFFETHLDPEHERHILSLLEENYFDALIILRCSLPYEEIEQYVTDKHNIVSCQSNDSDLISTIAIDFTSLKEKIVNYVNQGQTSFGIAFTWDEIETDEIKKTMRTTYDYLNSDDRFVYKSTACFKGGIKLAQQVMLELDQKPLPDVIWFDEVNCAAGFKQTLESNNIVAPRIIVLGTSGLARYANFIRLDCYGFEVGQSLYNLLGNPLYKGVMPSAIDVPDF